MKPRHVTLRRAWPERYFSGLSHSMKLRRELELMRRRGTPYSKLRMGRSNKGGTRQKSKWTLFISQNISRFKI